MAPPTFLNLGFEEPKIEFGVEVPGEADGWTRSTLVSEEEIASFGPSPRRPWEDMERGWSSNENDLFEFDAAHLAAAEFQTDAPAESFEAGWNNDTYALELVGAEQAQFYSAHVPIVYPETFGGPEDDEWVAWNGVDFRIAFEPGDLTAATFVGGAAFESFETGWRSNEGAIEAFDPANLTVGTFGEFTGLRVNHEGFEALRPPLPFVAIPASDVLDTAVDHGLAVNDHVYLTNLGGALPTPLDVRRSYYVQATPTTHTFKLAETLGGPAIDVLDVGTGDHEVYQDLDYHWKTEV